MSSTETESNEKVKSRSTTASVTPAKTEKINGGESSEPEIGESSSSSPIYNDGKCVACSINESSKTIGKDENFYKLLKLLWETLEIDVKPNEVEKQSVCISCFDSLVEFYDTEDVLVILENQLKTLRSGLINTAVKGIKELQSDKKPLLTLHKRIIERWPKGEDTDTAKCIKESSSFETFLEEPKTSKKNGLTPEQSPSKSKKRQDDVSSSDDKSKKPRIGPARISRPARATRSKRTYAESDNHSDAEEETDDNRQKITDGEDTEDENEQNKCQVCLDTFPSKFEVVQHLKEHTTDKSRLKFQCRMCKRGFGKANDLIDHKKRCQLYRAAASK